MAKKPASPKRASPALDGRVLSSLAAVLLVAQLPQVFRLPVWLSLAGIGLVLTRIALVRRGWAVPRSIWLLPLVVVVGLAIRWHYGYFFGRDPGVALLFVMAGLKFMETRTERDGTLVICLAAFLALTQFLYEQSLLSFVWLVTAVLAIAFSLHALSGTWRMGPSGGAFRLEAIRPLLRLAGTMLLQSVPLALLLFFVFPRLTQPLWGLPSDGGSKSGLSDQMEPGTISVLTLSDEVAFRVDFPDALQIPPNSRRYWRGPVLSQFDGTVWRAAPRANLGEIGRRIGTRVEYIVTLEPHQQRWLFALDLPSSMPHDDVGDPLPNIILTREYQLLSLPLVSSRMIYRQSSILADRHESTDGVELTRALRLPGTANPRARAFAVAERERAGSDTGYIRAMLRRFGSERFAYTLQPPTLGDNPIDGFLFDSQRGFCEHYAGAFAFLMRAAGIPARVVTGYMGGEINPASGTMIVRQSDAHAWVEAWFDGRWQRFDPTAAVAPERVERGLSAALPAGERVPMLSRPEWSWLREIDWRLDAVNHTWQMWVIGFNAERQKSLFFELGFKSPAPWQIAAVICGGIAAWGLGFIAWTQWRGRLRVRDPLERIWQRINRRLARAGCPRAAHEGPLAYRDRLCSTWPQHADLWRRCTAAYIGARYGRGDPEDGVLRLVACWLELRATSLPRTQTGAAATRPPAPA